MLSNDFDAAAALKPVESLKLQPEDLGLEKERHLVTIDAANCTEMITGPDEQGIYYAEDRQFHYDIALEFADEESKHAFLERNDVYQDILTIRSTVESALQSTMQVENQRDAYPFYGHGNPDDPNVVKTITENTQGDIESVMEDLDPIIKSTFPNAGITAVTIENVSGVARTCPAPTDWNFAQDIAPPTQTAGVTAPVPQRTP